MIITLIITLILMYLGVIHIAYFIFNPFFNNEIKYWSIYTLQFNSQDKNDTRI